MVMKINRAEIVVGDKKKVVLAKDVEDMGFVQAGAFAIGRGDGKVETYWGCPIVLYQEDDGVDVLPPNEGIVLP